jgi:spore maturation protein CgeB
MKVLFVGLEYEYYDVKRGRTFEYVNLYRTMKEMPGVEAVFFPIDDVVTIGKAALNRRLQEVVAKEKPDALFSFMFTEEIDQNVMAEISKSIVTIGYFADDPSRFDNYSKYYAKCFRYVCTTSSEAVPRYEKLGVKAIRAQGVANEKVFHPAFAAFPRRDFICDVSFVGQYHPQRAKIIDALRAAGIPVVVKGFGWPESPERISQDDIVRYFSLSKISLNLTPSSFAFNLRGIARLFLKKTCGHVETDFKNFFNNIKMWRNKRIARIKARMFEISACGGFVITGEAHEDIGEYYERGKEIETYRTTPELIEKIKYYLAHDAEREAIAQAGYERTIREHTYALQIEMIFKKVGML